MDRRAPKQKWGPALLPAPTAPSEGFAALPEHVPRDPLANFGSPAQASLPINSSLRRGARPPYFDAPAEAPLPVSGVRPDRSQNQPMFRGPSWDDLLASRFAVPRSEERRTAASRKWKIISSGASSRRAPANPRRNLLIACRQRSDLWSPAAPSCRCRQSKEAGTAVPIT